MGSPSRGAEEDFGLRLEDTLASAVPRLGLTFIKLQSAKSTFFSESLKGDDRICHQLHSGNDPPLVASHKRPLRKSVH